MLEQGSLAELHCKSSKANPLRRALPFTLVSEKGSLIILLLHLSWLTSHKHVSREAIEEAGIQQPKKVLVSMRRTESYRRQKLMLLHKLIGMRSLVRHYSQERSSNDRLWYTGFHLYSNRKQVEDLFNKGKPLCGFCSPEKFSEVCVAYHCGDSASLGCVVFSASHSQVTSEVVDTGVAFRTFTRCGFKNVEMSKQELKKDAMLSAVMLPYFKDKKETEASTYTLVYSDWDVLQTTNCELTKGPVRIHAKLHDLG